MRQGWSWVKPRAGMWASLTPNPMPRPPMDGWGSKLLSSLLSGNCFSHWATSLALGLLIFCPWPYSELKQMFLSLRAPSTKPEVFTPASFPPSSFFPSIPSHAYKPLFSSTLTLKHGKPEPGPANPAIHITWLASPWVGFLFSFLYVFQDVREQVSDVFRVDGWYILLDALRLTRCTAEIG